ncbi:MAG: hypothetical protein ABSD74_07870 [Rhizomicrobium sp.]|jgi:hypothetical protein
MNERESASLSQTIRRMTPTGFVVTALFVSGLMVVWLLSAQLAVLSFDDMLAVQARLLFRELLFVMLALYAAVSIAFAKTARERDSLLDQLRRGSAGS